MDDVIAITSSVACGGNRMEHSMRVLQANSRICYVTVTSLGTSLLIVSSAVIMRYSIVRYTYLITGTETEYQPDAGATKDTPRPDG